jgi:thioredoxin 1
MPSVAMIPYFEEFASDYPDFLFLSVDVDEVKVMLFLPSLFMIE